MTNKNYGSFFNKLVGKSVDKTASLEAINSEVERKQAKKLHVKACKSSVVSKRGNIFRYTQRYKNINEKIDSYLSE